MDPAFLALNTSNGRATLIVRSTDRQEMRSYPFNDVFLFRLIDEPPPKNIIGNEGLAI
jgi:hypothetical protein